MPWTPADAGRHKKGLSPKQARQWAKVANSALARCMSGGKSESSCAASAIRQANSVVGTPARSSSNARILSVQTALTVPPTRLTLNNRDYLTAPAVLLVAGVLNHGLVQDDELIADDWNSIPIVCNHPRDVAGVPISARSPEVLAQYGVGTLYRCRLSTGKRGSQVVRSLQAELWIDCAQVQALGGEALQALTMLEGEQPLEVSTGFYATALPSSGTFYGTPYTEMLTDLRPDHLALLPNEIGACSWTNGGCGAPRLHCEGCDATAPCAACLEGTTMTTPAPTPRGWRGFLAMLRDFVQREEVDAPAPAHSLSASAPDLLAANQTDADVRESLYSALAREMETDYTPVFIDSIDRASQSFVYRQGERLLQRTWALDAGGIITLDANSTDVQRDTRFTPIPGTTGPAQEPEDDEDSNSDLPQAMAVHAQCPTCGSELESDPDHPSLAATCPQCTPTANIPPPTPMQERSHMPQPPVSPVAIRARVNNLIANKQYGWAERDRAMLEVMPEATLIRLESQPILVPAPEPPPPPEPPKTPQEAIATLPAHLQDMFSQMHREYQERRQAALGILVANKSCPFEQEELQTFSVERLEKLVAMGAGVEYSGKGLPVPRAVPERLEDPPPAPDTMTLVIERQRAQGLRT